MKPLFTHLEDRLSAVPRWNIVRTIQKQSVMEHQGRVAIIADRIARDWFIMDDHDRLSVLQYALHHDRIEAVSGDIASIVKDLVDEEGMEDRYIDLMPDDFSDVTARVKHAVKLADKIEALVFIKVEIAMGNKTVDSVYANLINNLYEYCVKYDLLHQYFNANAFVANFDPNTVVHDRRPRLIDGEEIPF